MTIETEVCIATDRLSVTLGSFHALESVTFSLSEGEFLAILGPNGAGKSTLIRALIGLVSPSAGSVSIFGGAPKSQTQHIGYVPQIKALDRSFPALPIELVVSGLRRKWPWRIRASERKLAMEALQTAGMAEKHDRPAGKLSGGELQRVYLARALVRKPRLLLLDEPATGMDFTGEKDMYQVLDSYRKESGATIIMVTHDWDVASHHSTRVLLLNRQSEAFGPPQEVMRAEHLRRVFGHMGHAHPMIFQEE